MTPLDVTLASPVRLAWSRHWFRKMRTDGSALEGVGTYASTIAV